MNEEPLRECPCGTAPVHDSLEPDWCGCMNPRCEYFEVFYRVEKWNTRAEGVSGSQRERIDKCVEEMANYAVGIGSIPFITTERLLAERENFRFLIIKYLSQPTQQQTGGDETCVQKTMLETSTKEHVSPAPKSDESKGSESVGANTPYGGTKVCDGCGYLIAKCKCAGTHAYPTEGNQEINVGGGECKHGVPQGITCPKCFGIEQPSPSHSKRVEECVRQIQREAVNEEDILTDKRLQQIITKHFPDHTAPICGHCGNHPLTKFAIETIHNTGTQARNPYGTVCVYCDFWSKPSDLTSELVKVRDDLKTAYDKCSDEQHIWGTMETEMRRAACASMERAIATISKIVPKEEGR